MTQNFWQTQETIKKAFSSNHDIKESKDSYGIDNANCTERIGDVNHQVIKI